MNLLDLVVVAGALAAAVGGYRIGFLTRAASWAGLLIGCWAGIRMLPSAVALAGHPGPSGTLLVVAVVVVVGAFVGQALGLLVGHRVRDAVHEGSLQHAQADRVAGALAGGVSVLIGIWLVTPILSSLPGLPSRLADSSTVARSIAAVLPAAPDTGSALRGIASSAGFPEVYADPAEAAQAGPPPSTTELSPETERMVRASTVKVKAEGGDCNRIQEGTGFVIQRNVVVTNAHVIAGERHVSVRRHDGVSFRARVAVFDSRRDLAVLVVDRLDADPLGRADAEEGTTGAVLGHPRGSDEVRVTPYRIDQHVTAEGRDIYDATLTRRRIFVMAAALAPGDSGGPVVNVDGQVVAVAFAIAPDLPSTAYALTHVELDPVMAAFASDPGATASTGTCLP